MRVMVAVSRSAGGTPWTRAETRQVSPGSSWGESSICPALTRESPNGPAAEAACRALRMALRVLRIVYVMVASPYPNGLGVPE